jgi:hypothetical protein
MGIDAHFLRFLVNSSKQGVEFSRTATLGRQNFYRLSPALLRSTFRNCGVPLSEKDAAVLFSADGIYTESLMRFLGAKVVESIDNSAYENATHIFDMNNPAPAHLHGNYSVLIDGGSLEHIFNFPQAITNCMNMIQVGGHYIGLSPANNFFGHGFYQFSAELFFRVFEPRNGFETECILLVEDEDFGSGWFEVTDPAMARERVTLMSATPAYLYVRARKISDSPPFVKPPYQSDYATRWSAAKQTTDARATHVQPSFTIRGCLKSMVPSGAKHWFRQALFPGPRSRPDHYKRL